MKYGNDKTTIEGITFDSRREARRYCELVLMQRAGLISGLELQKTFELIPVQKVNGKCVERAVKYVADFVYTDESGTLCVEDAKGFRTKEYVIKRKLMLYRYGVQIKEV